MLNICNPILFHLRYVIKVFTCTVLVQLSALCELWLHSLRTASSSSLLLIMFAT